MIRIIFWYINRLKSFRNECICTESVFIIVLPRKLKHSCHICVQKTSTTNPVLVLLFLRICVFKYKTSSECLGKRSNNVFKRQNNIVIRTLYDVSITFLLNVIRQYKKTCHFTLIQTSHKNFMLRYLNVFKTVSKRFCIS